MLHGRALFVHFLFFKYILLIMIASRMPVFNLFFGCHGLVSTRNKKSPGVRVFLVLLVTISFTHGTEISSGVAKLLFTRQEGSLQIHYNQFI